MISWFIWFQLQTVAAVGLVLLLRTAMVKLPKVYSYVLWILVFVRLLCPLTFESDFGLMPSESEGTAWVSQNMTGRTKQVSQAQYQEMLNSSGDVNTDGTARYDGINNTERNTVSYGADSENNAVNTAVNRAGNITENITEITREASDNADVQTTAIKTFFANSVNRMIVFMIWSAVAAAILVYNGFALSRVRRQIKKAENIRDNIYVCRGISAPFTLGIIHPGIYLPDGEESEREYIICHEMVHIRRKDYIIKNIAFLLTALYWFNPFVWLAFYFLERDMEMSCDEKVIKLMGADIKKQYSQSLLNFADGKLSPAMTPLTFGENSVKQRVKNVLAYKNAKRWTIAAGIVVIAAACLILFTARNNENITNNSNNTNNTDSDLTKTDFTDVSDIQEETDISIANKAEFEDYYGMPDAEGSYTFSVVNTGYGTAFYAAIISNIMNGASADYSDRYTDPVSAAQTLLHLEAGSGEVIEEKRTATPEEEWFGEDSVPDRYLSMADMDGVNYALVRYTFDADGSQVDIPMEIIEESCGVWAPVSGMRRDIYQLRQEDLGEICCIEISRYGIYRLDSEGLRCIYLGYVAPDAGLYISENILYFEADSECTFESLDYYADVIAMLDLDSGIVDMETIKLNSKAQSVFPLKWLSVWGGFINLCGENGSYVMPLINVGTGPLSDNTAPSDEQEIDTYAAAVRQKLLDNPGLTLCLSNRTLTETYGYVDLDGDQKAEKITLKSDEDYKEYYENAEMRPLDNFILEAGDSSVKKFGENVYNDIWAVSLDGKEILIEIYEDGPSADPITTFYAYREGKLKYVGEIPEENINFTIEDGIINANIRNDVLQTDWIKTKWYMNDSGQIERQE